MSNIYLCPPLLAAFNSKQPVKIAIGGRGTGKSTYLGLEMRQAAAEMPRSKGSLGGPTYSQVLTKILPSAKKMLLATGLIEDQPNRPGHFCIGRKPPAYFARAYNEPERYEYVISFFNGSAVELISMDRPDAARGGSYDYKMYDEAVLMKKSFHDNVDIMTLRGNRQYFRKCDRHGMRVYVSSQAHSSVGYWVEDQKFLRDDHGELVRGADGEPRLDPEIFCEVFSSWANVSILGESTIKMWKKVSSPASYDIEVMSLRGGRLPNGFYPAFDSKIHTYFGGYEYDYDEKTEFGMYVKREDTDREPSKPLMLTCDFNASLNTLIVAQEHPNEVRFLNEFFENGNESTETWLRPFVEFYRNHKEKVIYLYGDPGGNKTSVLDQRSSYQKMEEYLNKHGWKLQNMVRGKAYPGHKQKQEFINDMLTEKDAGLPKIRFNYTRCRNSIISIENTPIKPDFKKDKSSETKDIDQRQATHPSDAFDYLMWFRYNQKPILGAGRADTIRIGGRIV